MAGQASLLQEGVDRFNHAVRSIDVQRIQKQIQTRRRSFERQLTSGRKNIEKRTRTSEGFRRRRRLGMTDAWFRDKLRHYEVRAVSLNQSAPLAEPVRSALRKEGFVPTSSGGGYEEWLREKAWSGVRPQP